jgi:cation transport regulator ChaC
MPLVFQYGPNTSQSRLNAPDRFNGHARDEGRACTVEGWDIAFDVWSETDTCAAADLVRVAGRQAWGVLYEIPDGFIRGTRSDGQKTLEEIEGPQYEETTVHVLNAQGQQVDAVTFVARATERRPDIATSKLYVSGIICGLREHGVLEQYITHLEEVAFPHSLVTLFSYAYLLRIPILIGLVLIALPPLALLWGPLESLLENMFVLTPANIFWAMIPALTLAWSLVVVSRVILLNGKERFGIDQWLQQDTLKGWQLLLGSLPALSLFICACVEKSHDAAWVPWWKWLGAAFLGALTAYMVGFLGLVISVALAPVYTRRPANQRFANLFPFSTKILAWAEGLRLIPQPDLSGWPAELKAGYVDWEGHLYPGQWLVLMLLVMSGLVYLIVGFYKLAHLGVQSNVPAIAYVLILMLMLNWVLSPLAFFLDRYRVPLLLPIALFCWLGGQSSLSDHYFALRDDKARIHPASPSEALAVRAPKFPQTNRPNGSVVVIATAGGGIQAAAWTARVLTGLQDQCPARPGNTFADSIAVISAVSGGAVGTMFFVKQYQSGGTTPGFHATSADLQRIVDQAEAPVLSDVAWAIAYVDPLRTVFPYLPKVQSMFAWPMKYVGPLRIFSAYLGSHSEREKTYDRGFVLEQTWRNVGSLEDSLSDWREGVGRGDRPGIIFNSTLAETGKPFLLATTQFDTGTEKPARETFTHLYPKRDIPVVTAARLGASFPYVSPATRALTDNLEPHVVDGGYYDNFGVDSLSSWLDQALEGLDKDGRPKPDVLVIQIRSFPTGADMDLHKKGWFYQSYAPINALLSVRTTAQLVRDRDELKLLQKKWAAVNFQFATFEFPGKDAPLSWQLTQRQKDTIEAEWHDALTNPQNKNHCELLSVRSFCRPQLGAMPATAAAPR